MKVLMVCNMPLSKGAGAEVFCYDLANELSTRGIDIVTICGRSNASPGEFELPRTDRKLSRKLLFDYYNPRAKSKLEEILSKINPDVVHFHNVYGISSSLIRMCSEKGIKTVVTIHDRWPLSYRQSSFEKRNMLNVVLRPFSYLHRKIRLRHLSGARIVATSQFMEKMLKEAGYKDISLIPLGIHLPENTAKDSRRAIFVGRIERVKGADMLPKLAALLKPHNIEIHVAGTGPYLNNLRGIDNLILHGMLERDDLHNFYGSGGVLLFLSRLQENSPVSILEAMSYGIPVVAFHRGGVSEMVLHNETGKITVEDAKCIVRDILDILDDERIKTQMMNNCREHSSRYSWDKTTRSYISMYEST